MDDIEPIYGLILAGGESRRMGQAKGLLEYRGKTLLTHCIEQLNRNRDWMDRLSCVFSI